MLFIGLFIQIINLLEVAKTIEDKNANIISIPARFMSLEKSIQIINIFLTEPFEGGRHKRRVNKI